MESHSPRPRTRKVTFHARERGKWLSMLWDLGFCKCQHSQFTYSLLIKRNLPILERVPLSQPGFDPRTSRKRGFYANHYTIWVWRLMEQNYINIFNSLADDVSILHYFTSECLFSWVYLFDLFSSLQFNSILFGIFQKRAC